MLNLGLGTRITQAPAAAVLDTFRYHFDSNAGEMGDGSAAAPWKWPSSLPELVDGDSVGLRGNSHWQGVEGFHVENVPNVRFGQWGSGARPIIDGSKEAPNAEFTKTDGYSDIWEITVDMPGTAGHWINWFRDGGLSLHAADLSALDAAPGKYFVADHDAASPTIYFNPGEGIDPRGDGVAYRWTGCEYGIYLNAAGCTIEDIVAGRHSLNVSFFTRGFGAMRRCRVFQGGRHLVIMGAGSVVQDTEFDELYWGPYFGIGPIVFFDDVFDGETCAVIDCAFQGWTLGTSGVAIDSHCNSGSLARIDVLRGTITQMDSGIGTQDVDLLNIDGVAFIDVPAAVVPTGPVTHVRNCTHENSITGIYGQYFLVTGSADQTVIAEGNVANLLAGQGFARCTGTNANITLTGNSCHISPWAGFPIVMVRVDDGALQKSANTWRDDNGQYPVVISAGTVLSSDDEIYTGYNASSTNWVANGDLGAGLNFADWKSATGADANSIVN